MNTGRYSCACWIPVNQTLAEMNVVLATIGHVAKREALSPLLPTLHLTPQCGGTVTPSFNNRTCWLRY